MTNPTTSFMNLTEMFKYLILVIKKQIYCFSLQRNRDYKLSI